MDYCDHPVQEWSVVGHNADHGHRPTIECAFCGHRWVGEYGDEQKIRDLTPQEPSKRVMMCTCGKVLENPAAYAAHCKEAPDHFTHSD